MDIRKEVINYRKTLGEIEQIKLDIEYKKSDLMPNNTQIITGMPFAHGNSNSNVESTVDKFEKNLDIKELQIRLNHLIYIKRTIDAQILKLNVEEREYIKYHTEGISIDDLVQKFTVEHQTVRNRLAEIRNKLKQYYEKVA